jgi:hypothetical protein
LFEGSQGKAKEMAQRRPKELLKELTSLDDKRMTGDSSMIATAERGRVVQDCAHTRARCVLHIGARFVLHIQLTFGEGEPRKAPSIIFSDNARVYTPNYGQFNTVIFNYIQLYSTLYI